MFRPCIDLHEGRVKQIVGASLGADGEAGKTNFVSEHPAEYYAELYRRDGLRGGHVILLGPGNEPPARRALAAYPGGLQVGGGIDAANATHWLEAGASHVIVTSWLFPDGHFDPARLAAMVRAVGAPRLVIDLSCRRVGEDYCVATQKWTEVTDLRLSAETLSDFAQHCAEFLVHAVDVEGLRQGVDLELVRRLTRWSPLPATYAGGARSLADLEEVTRVSEGRVDLTIGSALDLFGGTGVRYAHAVAFNRRWAARQKEM